MYKNTHNIRIQEGRDNHFHVVHLVHEATSTNLFVLLFSLSKESAHKNHGSFMADFIFPRGSMQRDTSNFDSPPLGPFKKNQLIEEIINSPSGHIVNLKLLQQLGTPNQWAS